MNGKKMKDKIYNMVKIKAAPGSKEVNHEI
jgi:hypothetical protein